MKNFLSLKNIIFLVFAAFFVNHQIGCQDFAIAQSLKKAQTGDYLVSTHGKNFTLFHIFDSRDNTLVIEEISAPLSEVKKIKGLWQEWINRHAPGHLSWVMYELDLNTTNIEQMYSFSQRCWQKIYPQEQIFPTLISLQFKLIPDSHRKKAGPPPPLEMPDDRSIWNPPIFYYGKKIKLATCNAYQALWPQDGSELANKKIEIYLPQDSEKVPNYFPFWVQASNHFAQAKMRVIDSGRGLKSIHTNLPTPPLELIAHQYNAAGDLQFELKTHPSFLNYRVYIRLKDDMNCESIPFSLYQDPSHRRSMFTIANDDLNNKLKVDKLYYFIFEPQEHPQMSVETTKPISIAKPYVHQ